MGVIARLLGWGIRLGLVAFVLTFAAVAYLSWDMATDRAGAAALARPVDAVIVLGGGVDGDGRIGYSSRRRVASAARLIAEGGASHMIVTGGVGRYHPATRAGGLMRDHAEAIGVAPERVLVEPRAVSTFENLRFAFEIAEREGFGRLALLSDPFHLARARALAAWYGRDVAIVAATGFEREWLPQRLLWLGREALAWWLNLAKVAGWEGLGLLGLPEDSRAELIR